MNSKSYATNENGVSVQDGLSFDEISNVHYTWREIRDYPEWESKTWKQYKNSLGLDFDIKRIPSWKITNKDKWLWAKLKYSF